MEIVSYSDTQQKEIRTKEQHTLVRGYYGKVAALCEGPQVFLVDMPDAGGTIHPHFHDVDQYQVIVRGGGRLGPGTAEPVAFHYADAYTPYGPIIGADDGIAFFTIRAACAGGYFPMPASRHLIKGKPGRNIAGKFDVNQPLPAARESTREVLLESTADHVAVVGLRMGPHARANGEPTNGGDQYYLVCSGALAHEGREIPPLSMVRVEPGEAPPVLEAGPTGAEILLLQLPMPTGRPGATLKTLAERGLTEVKLPEGITID